MLDISLPQNSHSGTIGTIRTRPVAVPCPHYCTLKQDQTLIDLINSVLTKKKKTWYKPWVAIKSALKQTKTIAKITFKIISNLSFIFWIWIKTLLESRRINSTPKNMIREELSTLFIIHLHHVKNPWVKEMLRICVQVGWIKSNYAKAQFWILKIKSCNLRANSLSVLQTFLKYVLN